MSWPVWDGVGGFIVPSDRTLHASDTWYHPGDQPGRSESRFIIGSLGPVCLDCDKGPGRTKKKKNGFFHPLRKILENSFTFSESEDYVW